MLYSFLKPLVKVSLSGYFRRIDLVGSEHLEADRAIYVSNHPGAMMDPILLASLAEKELHFIAGAEWFGTGFRERLFKNEFNMIPVFRPWLAKGTGEQADNDAMFAACYESLAKGKRILIYPEASSQTVPWLREFKTGAARIKLGADLENPELPPVKIIPVGVNYTNPHRFQSRVLLKVGAPLSFDELVVHSQDPKELARAMTEKIRNSMKELVWHVEHPDDFPLVRAAMKLLTDRLMSDANIPLTDYKQAFLINQKVIAKVQNAKEHSPKNTLELERKATEYISEYESLGLYRFNPFEMQLKDTFLLIGGCLIALPLMVLGLLINGLPFFVVQLAFNRLVRSRVTGEQKDGAINHAFAGALAYLAGLLVFLMWYVAGVVVLAQYMEWWVAWPTLWFFGYWLGRFSLVYYRWFKRSYRLLKWYWFKVTQPKRIEALLANREVLISDLMAVYSSSPSPS